MGIKCSRYNIKGSSFRDQTEEEGSIILTYFKFQATKIRAKKKKKNSNFLETLALKVNLSLSWDR